MDQQRRHRRADRGHLADCTMQVVVKSNYNTCVLSVVGRSLSRCEALITSASAGSSSAEAMRLIPTEQPAGEPVGFSEPAALFCERNWEK